MKNKDELRSAINTVLISGVDLDTKIEQIIHAINHHPNCEDPVIIGWIDIHLRKPDYNEYIDIRYNDGTIVYERLFTDELKFKLIQKNALWKPTFI